MTRNTHLTRRVWLGVASGPAGTGVRASADHNSKGRKSRFRSLRPWLLVVACLGTFSIANGWSQNEPQIESPQTVAVIGTGRVGGALGPRLGELGFTVIYGSRDPSQPKVQSLLDRSGKSAIATNPRIAAGRADIVLLAVPWEAAEDVVAGLGDLGGKIVIDAVNPLKPADDGLLEMAVPTSAAEYLQAWAPGARIVKAFNTMGSTIMADPAAAGGAITVPLASDDHDAKAIVRDIVLRLGFEVADVGPLRSARYLEGMVVLMVVPTIQGRREDAWEYYFRIRPQPKQAD